MVSQERVTADEYRAQQAASMKEAALQSQADRMAVRNGWLAYHTYDSRRSPSGYPDSTYVRAGVMFLAEYKQQGKYPTAKQREWIAAITAAGIVVFVWRPIDWFSGAIDKVLEAPPGTPMMPGLVVTNGAA